MSLIAPYTVSTHRSSFSCFRAAIEGETVCVET